MAVSPQMASAGESQRSQTIVCMYIQLTVALEMDITSVAEFSELEFY